MSVGLNRSFHLGCAAALVLPVRGDLAAVALGVLCGGLLIMVPYSRYVSVLKWLTLALLAYVATVFVSSVDPVQLRRSTGPLRWPRWSDA